MEQEKNKIIIANNNTGEILKNFFAKATTQEEIRLQFHDRYEGTAESIARKIKYGAGWIEENRGSTNTINPKCIHNEGKCTCNKKLEEENIKKEETLRCTTTIRQTCKYYKKKYKHPFKVKYIDVKLIGQVRSLRK